MRLRSLSELGLMLRKPKTRKHIPMRKVIADPMSGLPVRPLNAKMAKKIHGIAMARRLWCLIVTCQMATHTDRSAATNSDVLEMSKKSRSTFPVRLPWLEAASLEVADMNRYRMASA